MLKFNEAEHKYFDDQTNVVYPSVTTVINEVLKAERPYFANAASAMNKGTIVHKTLELLDAGNLESYDPRIQKYVEAWEKFKKEHNVVIMQNESIMLNETYGFAGTIDRVIEMGEQRNVAIADIKTGSYYSGYEIQTAGYEVLYGGRVDFRMDVMLKDNGTYKLEIHNSRLDKEIFLSCLNIYKWRKSNGCLSRNGS